MVSSRVVVASALKTQYFRAESVHFMGNLAEFPPCFSTSCVEPFDAESSGPHTRAEQKVIKTLMGLVKHWCRMDTNIHFFFAFIAS